MKFKGFERLSLIEWPGKICAVVFVGGCNFNCLWCYNWDLAQHPEKLLDIDQVEILKYLAKNKHLLDGVMITGGEPLATPEFPISNFQFPNNLTNFIKKIKEMSLGVGIETNGTNPGAIEYLISNKFVDYIAMDVKAPLTQEKYDQLTGVNTLLDPLTNSDDKRCNTTTVRRSRLSAQGVADAKNIDRIGEGVDKIKKSIEIIIDKAPDYEFRTTVVPGLLDENDILEIAEFIKGAKRYYLQQFRPLAKWSRPPYQSDFFINLQNKIKNYFAVCEVRQ